jgi:hypothetical protein
MVAGICITSRGLYSSEQVSNKKLDLESREVVEAHQY